MVLIQSEKLKVRKKRKIRYQFFFVFPVLAAKPKKVSSELLFPNMRFQACLPFLFVIQKKIPQTMQTRDGPSSDKDSFIKKNTACSGTLFATLKMKDRPKKPLIAAAKKKYFS